MSLPEHRMTHLKALEAESIHIIREVAAEFDNPVMMYSIGKDSSVMLHLARKAFAPGKPPFPLMHVNTTWKFKEMISFRDRIAKEAGMELISHTNPEGLAANINPFDHGSSKYTDIMKTQALKQALDAALAEARKAFETVPWVRRAEVRRVWPHDLVVRIEEHRPVAYWAREDTDHLLVNTHGELFEVNLGDVEDDTLPTLAGPRGTSLQVMTLWRRLVPVLAPLRQRVSRVVLSDRGSWRVQLDRGTVIELGRGEPDQIVARTQRFVGSVGQITDRFERRAIEYADLRHSESYALRLVGMGTMPMAPPAGKGH